MLAGRQVPGAQQAQDPVALPGQQTHHPATASLPVRTISTSLATNADTDELRARNPSQSISTGPSAAGTCDWANSIARRASRSAGSERLLCRLCTRSGRSAAGDCLRGEPVVRCPTEAIARRPTTSSRGSTCASSGPCSRPPALGPTAECVAKRYSEPGSANARKVADPIAPVEAEHAIAFGDCDRPPCRR